MDIIEIVKMVFDVPIYVWVILFFILAFISRDRSRWEKEVEFPWVEGIGKVEVEIEHNKRTGTEIEIEMKLDARYQNRPIEIYINDDLVCTVPEGANNGSGRGYKEPYQFGKPNSGDSVKVIIDRETIFSGNFR